MPYLDNNATTEPLPEVVDAVRTGLTEHWHNPSSVHRPGQAARHAVELARADLARLINVKPRELILMGSGTESIDAAIRGSIAATGKRVVVTTEVEHAAVRDLCEAIGREGVEVRTLPLIDGVVDPSPLSDLLAGGDVAVVSVQWANNETGAIVPVERIHEACRAHRVAFHCDGTQWIGKLPVPQDGPPCDLLTFSAHKFHGPKGVGGLWVRRGIGIRPVLHGSQELGRRGGTENVPGILGAGVAARAAVEWLADAHERERLTVLRDRFEAAVLEQCPGAMVNGPANRSAETRLWNTTNIGFPRLEAEALLLAFSEQGLAASAGAACSSGSLDPSPVLLAIGIEPAVAHGSVRFSLSRFTSEAEIDEAVEIVSACVSRFASIG
ncbi:MAG: cysteine desulfurase family protein [Planctomycetota bacterium]